MYLRVQRTNTLEYLYNTVEELRIVGFKTFSTSQPALRILRYAQDSGTSKRPLVPAFNGFTGETFFHDFEKYNI